MKRSQALLFTLTCTVLVFALTGCTPEKAQALVTAIKSFEAKSLLAINAYEQLFKDYRFQERESNDQVFLKASDAIRKHGKDAVTLDLLVSALSRREQKRADESIEREFSDIKVVYSALRRAYESLPQGSLLGAKHVSCGQDVVAKATSQLVNFSVNINNDPLYPQAIRLQVAQYKKLAADGKDQEARVVFNEIATAIARYDANHEQAIKLTLAAVEDGRKVHKLLGDYDAVSIADILGVVQFGIDFLGTLEGVDVGDAASRLEGIKNELGDQDYWKRIEALPVADVGDCELDATVSAKGG